MLSLVEPNELGRLKRSARFTLLDMCLVVQEYTGHRVSMASLSLFLAEKAHLKLETWLAVTRWYTFYVETAPIPPDRDVNRAGTAGKYP